MERIPLIKLNDGLLINPRAITSIRYHHQTWYVYDGEGHFGIDITDDEYDKLKQFLIILEKPEDVIFMDLSNDVDNFATDLWGGAGPDCIGKRLVAASLN